ncbi:MAG: glycosyltransferase family 4 protein [Cyclobacteriaceae bacterium]
MGKQKIRVLFLITDLCKGGAERSITDLCLQFKQRDDIECVIGSLLPGNDFMEETEKLNVEVLNYQTNSLFKKSHTPAYHQLVKDFKPHIIHSNRFLAEFLTAEIIYPEVIYVCHGRDNMVQLKNLDWHTFVYKKLFLNFVEKQTLLWRKYGKTKTWFIANSSHTRAYFEKVLPNNCKERIRIIHNGVDYRKFYNPPKKIIKFGKKVKLINIGSFQEKKNQMFFIPIAKELNKRGLDYEINLIGDGEKKAEVEDLVKTNNLESKFYFHGKVDNVEKWLRESDIYVHTAWYEPFGIVFLEAMASGLPVVTLDGKGNRDLIKDGCNGFFIEKQDANQFADRIIQLIVDRVLYKTMSNHAQCFSKTFDMETKAQEYYDFYKSIASNANIAKG